MSVNIYRITSPQGHVDLETTSREQAEAILTDCHRAFIEEVPVSEREYQAAIEAEIEAEETPFEL